MPPAEPALVPSAMVIPEMVTFDEECTTSTVAPLPSKRTAELAVVGSTVTEVEMIKDVSLVAL